MGVKDYYPRAISKETEPNSWTIFSDSIGFRACVLGWGRCEVDAWVNALKSIKRERGIHKQ